MTRLVSSSPGTCRDCMRKREVFSATRRGGGSYNRAPRRNSASICAECAIRLLDRADTFHDPNQWETGSLSHIVASIDSDEARRVTAGWQAKLDAREADRRAEHEKSRPYWDRVTERKQAIAWVRAQIDNPDMHTETCYRLVFDLERGLAGNESTGLAYVDGTMTWPKTIREQFTEFILGPSETLLHGPTCRSIALGLAEGRHIPTDPAQDKA